MPTKPGPHAYSVGLHGAGLEARHTGAFQALKGSRKGLIRVDREHPRHFLWDEHQQFLEQRPEAADAVRTRAAGVYFRGRKRNPRATFADAYYVYKKTPRDDFPWAGDTLQFGFDQGPVKQGRHVVRRARGVTTYELAISWSELEEWRPQAAQKFGFTFRVNNNQGPALPCPVGPCRLNQASRTA